MAPALVPDTLWEIIEPLLPLPKPKPQGGRPRVPDRVCLKGIVFVLRSGIAWEMLPKELGCGSGMTCWRRLRDWQEAGIWDLIHFANSDIFDYDFRTSDHRTLSIPHYAGNSAGGLSLP